MFTLFVLFVFVWLFVKSVGLAFHVTWGLAKFVATLLFVIALPLLVVFAVVGALLPLLLPPLLPRLLLPLPLLPELPLLKFSFLSVFESSELHGGFLSLRCRRGILVVRAFCACYHPTKRFFP